MRCPNCQFENPEGMKFCGECGAPLQNRCPNCGADNPPRFKFCGECGSPLAAQTPTPAPAPAPKPQPAPDSEGTRRQLTVMFCDLVGSTALSEQLDPEELLDIVRAYQEMCAAVITRFEGHIAKYLGDGMLVYFGYPLAHEDDAQRAVHTGLNILAELPELNARLRQIGAKHTPPLQARIGIHTGLVVVGEMGGGDYREQMAIVGDTPNIAARMQEIAQPDSVVISAATHRIVQGYFECFDLGARALKGISTPVQVYRVLRESEIHRRLELSAAMGLTPLVGREREVEFVRGRWEQVKDGFGQVVLLSGEPGIGKSRLVHEVKEHTAQESHALVECYCSPNTRTAVSIP